MTNKLATKPLRQVQSVQELLMNDMARDQLSKVAASHMRPERMMRLMANAIRTTPKLTECEPISLLGAMMTCASLGLEPNTVLGHAYLIPFKNRSKNITEVQLIIGYKGMIDLARRSGHVVNIHADVVYSGDEFSFEYGTDQHLRHKPAGPRENPEYAYCHAKLTDGEAFIVIPYAEVLKIRDASQGYRTAIKYNKKDTPWIAQEHQMARKTAVRALFNELPISIEKVSDALSIDDQSTDYQAFAMDPTGDMPMGGDGDVIEGEAYDPETGEVTEEEDEDETPPVEEEPKPAPRKKAAAKPKPKPEPKPEPEQYPETDGVEEFAGLVSTIKSELQEASNAGEIEAVLDMFATDMEPMQGTESYTEIQDFADARREEVA